MFLFKYSVVCNIGTSHSSILLCTMHGSIFATHERRLQRVLAIWCVKHLQLVITDSFRCCQLKRIPASLQWRHNRRDSVSNQQPHDCVLNRLFRRTSKKRWPVNSPHKWPVRRNMFQFDDVIMFEPKLSNYMHVVIWYRRTVCPYTKTHFCHQLYI